MADVDLQTKLADEVGPAPWAEIAAHAARDAVFLVDPSVPLVEAAAAVANDEADRVGAWVRSGALARPTRAELDAWEQRPAAVVDCVVVAPFVLTRRPG